MSVYKVTVTVETDVYFNGDSEEDIMGQYDRMLDGGVPINILEQLGQAMVIQKIEKVK